MERFRQRIFNKLADGRAKNPKYTSEVDLYRDDQYDAEAQNTQEVPDNDTHLVKTSLFDVTHLLEVAITAIGRRWASGMEYQSSAVVANMPLGILLNRLQVALDSPDPPKAVHKQELLRCMAEIHLILGHLELAEESYRAIFPTLTVKESVIVGLHASLLQKARSPEPNSSPRPLIEDDKILLLEEYLNFLVRQGRKSELAAALIPVLPWLLPNKPDITEKFLRITIQYLNNQSKFAEARNQLNIWRSMYIEAGEPLWNSSFTLQSAILAAGCRDLVSLLEFFTISYITSSTSRGMWCSSALAALDYYGRALTDLDLHKAAIVILEEFIMGSFHVSGWSHPSSRLALAAFRTCNISPSRMKQLQRFAQADSDKDRRLSETFRHIHLNTPVDVLRDANVFRIDYHNIIKTLNSPMFTAYFVGTRAGISTRRTIAQCKFELGDAKAAREYLKFEGINLDNVDQIAIQLDMVKYSDDPLRSSKALLQLCGKLHLPNHQSAAVHRSLTIAGFMHFTRDVLAENPPLISDSASEMLRRGAYAIVESVKIGDKCYARKSIGLPRHNQTSARKAIQNEISIMKNLNHPHIVQLYLTYEDKFRFYIVMQPLADFDLEAYLEHHSQTPPTQDQKKMIWKWLLCLANTLAYIHSLGIRHKDIKSRNILIKGEEVVYADFGSSYAFHNEGESTTEGPAFGHTKIYCAPEVLANGKRGRSSDIFSLGCVFTELAAWLQGWSIEHWNQLRTIKVDGVPTIAYAATLESVRESLSSSAKVDILVCGLYWSTIQSMLDKSSDDRPTAMKTSRNLIDCYGAYHKAPGLQRYCRKCKLDMWVGDTNDIAESIQSLDIDNLK